MPHNHSNLFRNFVIALALGALLAASQGAFGQTGRTSKHPIVIFPPTNNCNTDFGGDALNDIVFFNTESNKWVMYGSGGTTTSSSLGQPGDQPVAADYDGDNVIDIATVRYAGGELTWLVRQSADQLETKMQWGMDGDVPVKGDYDGDGRSDVAVWRPSEGNWYILTSSNGELLTLAHGLSTDKAMPGDYDGDGKTDAGVFRLTDFTFYFLGSLDQKVHSQNWSAAYSKGDTFVPADYDGDNKTDFSTFNAESGVWVILQSSDGIYRTENLPVIPLACGPWDIPCIEDDVAFPSDYDSDGLVDPAIWNMKNGSVNTIGSTAGVVNYRTQMFEGEAPVCVSFISN